MYPLAAPATWKGLGKRYGGQASREGGLVAILRGNGAVDGTANDVSSPPPENLLALRVPRREREVFVNFEVHDPPQAFPHAIGCPERVPHIVFSCSLRLPL